MLLGLGVQINSSGSTGQKNAALLPNFVYLMFMKQLIEAQLHNRTPEPFSNGAAFF